MAGTKVSDATTRLQLREQERRHRRIVRVVSWTLAVVVIAAAVYVVAFSPVFAVRQIAISGTKVLSKQDVIAASGVVVGAPLALVDPGQVADRLAGLPPVAEVTVVRGWPNTVQISITERRARLAIPVSGGYLLADAGGVVFDTVDAPPPGLVTVQAPTSDRQLLVDVGVVFSALSSDTAAKVDRVEATSRDDIELKLNDGSRVIWGDAEQSALKSQVLDNLLALGGRQFDVSAPGFPARR